MGSGSRCGGCGGLLAWDEAACAGCAVWGGRCRGTGVSRATGCVGVCDIAVVVVAGEFGAGSGSDVDGLNGGSASPEAAEGARGGGGGLGAAVVEDRSRFVVMATDMIIGGGVTGAACVMVIWTIGGDAGTKVICGRVGIGEAGGVAGICWGGTPPCRSSFFCSSVAIRVLIRVMLCCVSLGLPMRSLWCRCSWNSGDFSPNVRRMHSRNCNSVLALAASRYGKPSRPRSSTSARNSWSFPTPRVSSSIVAALERERDCSDVFARAIECEESLAQPPQRGKKTWESGQGVWQVAEKLSWHAGNPMAHRFR